MPHPDAARARALSLWGQILSGVLTALGVLGLLRSGLSGFGEEPRNLLVFDLHPVTSSVHLVLGLAGTLLVRRPGAARLFVRATGALLLVWGLLTAVAGGTPHQLLQDDREVALLYLIGGAISLVVAYAPSARTRHAGAA